MSPVQTRIPKTDHGFTLVELLVVMLMLGILGALTVPGFRTGLARQQLDSAARLLTADIREVQDMVLNHESGDEFKVHFRKDRYSILKNTRVIKAVCLPSGVEITASVFGSDHDRVWFSGGSVAPRDGGGKVVLEHRATALQSKVIVKPVTGRVRTENSWVVSSDQE